MFLGNPEWSRHTLRWTSVRRNPAWAELNEKQLIFSKLENAQSQDDLKVSAAVNIYRSLRRQKQLKRIFEFRTTPKENKKKFLQIRAEQAQKQKGWQKDSTPNLQKRRSFISVISLQILDCSKQVLK